MSSKSKKKSYSGKKLLDAVEGTSVKVEELTEEIISPGNVTSGITMTGKQSVSMQIELILSLIPAKGGVSNATIQKMQVELEELFDTEVSKAVGAAESRIRAECALSSSTSKTDVIQNSANLVPRQACDVATRAHWRSCQVHLP